MSEIDQYHYRCLGIVACPSTYEPFKHWSRQIPLYRFDSDNTTSHCTFQAKKGDVLLGGGEGECGALRIAIPEAFLAFTCDDWDGRKTYTELLHAFWSATEAFIFGEGFLRRGWDPRDVSLENWLCDHIMGFLVRAHSETYATLVGPYTIEQDGSIFRFPTAEEYCTLRSARGDQ